MLFYDASFTWLLLALLTIGTLWAYLARRFGLALGLLVIAASFSRLTAPLGDLNIRLEQPAILALSALVVATRLPQLVDLLHRAWLPAILGAIYIGANIVASAIHAPVPEQSLQIAAWLGISMAGAGIVALVVAGERRGDLELGRWVFGAAAIQVAVGVAAVLSQIFLRTDWGVLTSDVLVGKTYGLSWEPNLLAINLGMALMFVVAPGDALRLGPRGRLAALFWLALGLGLAYSRGGLLAVAIALVGLLIAVAWHGRAVLRTIGRTLLAQTAGLGALALLVALGTVQGLNALATAGVGASSNDIYVGGVVTPAPTIRPSVTASARSTGHPSATPSSTPSPEPTPKEPPRFVGAGDTVGLRLNNLRLALVEVPVSPFIGLGTDSFGQRHEEPSCACPAHVANLPIATLYESGIIGLVGLIGLLTWIVAAAWRLPAWPYLGTILVMLVGYQITDAFRFASNWLLLGVVIGLMATPPGEQVPDPTASSAGGRAWTS